MQACGPAGVTRFSAKALKMSNNEMVFSKNELDTFGSVGMLSDGDSITTEGHR